MGEEIESEPYKQLTGANISLQVSPKQTNKTLDEL